LELPVICSSTVQRYCFQNFISGVVEKFRRRYILQIVTAELQTANVAYFQRKIQLSGISAYPDGSLSQWIRISGVLPYLTWALLQTCSALRRYCSFFCTRSGGNTKLVERHRTELDNQLTVQYCKHHNHCSKDNIMSATQQITHILLNLLVSYRLHKTPPLVSILSQNGPGHFFPRNF